MRAFIAGERVKKGARSLRSYALWDFILDDASETLAGHSEIFRRTRPDATRQRYSVVGRRPTTADSAANALL
jgi:hypothetical protein